MIVAPAREPARVAFTGPVQTSLSINSRLLVERDLDAVQRRIVERLHKAGGPEGGAWHAPESSAAGRMERDIDNRRGRTVLPYYVVAWHVAGEAVRRHLDPAQAYLYADDTARAADTPMAAFRPRALAVRINHFGFGSVTLDGAVVPDDDLDAAALRGCVEQFSSALSHDDAFNNALGSVVRAVRGVLDAMSREDGGDEGWLVAGDAVFRDPAQEAERDVELFWFHRVFGLKWTDDRPEAELCADARELVFQGRAPQIAERSMRGGIDYLIGEGNSVAIYPAGLDDGEDRAVPCMDLLVDLIRMHNVYYAAATRLDKRLFQIGNGIILNSDRKDMGSLEDNADTIVDYYERASFFEAVYRDYEDHLDTDSHALWDCIAAAWATRDKFDAIERKLAYLEKIYDRAMQSITHLQNQRLNIIVLVFTFLSLGSVAVDLASYVHSEVTAPEEWNWANTFVISRILLGLITIILIGYVVFRWFRVAGPWRRGGARAVRRLLPGRNRG